MNHDEHTVARESLNSVTCALVVLFVAYTSAVGVLFIRVPPTAANEGKEIWFTSPKLLSEIGSRHVPRKPL